MPLSVKTQPSTTSAPNTSADKRQRDVVAITPEEVAADISSVNAAFGVAVTAAQQESIDKLGYYSVLRDGKVVRVEADEHAARQPQQKAPKDLAST